MLSLPATVPLTPGSESENRGRDPAMRAPNRQRTTLLAFGVVGAGLVAMALTCSRSKGDSPGGLSRLESLHRCRFDSGHFSTPTLPGGTVHTPPVSTSNLCRCAARPSPREVDHSISTPQDPTVKKRRGRSPPGTHSLGADLAAEPGEDKLLLRLIGCKKSTIDGPSDPDGRFPHRNGSGGKDSCASTWLEAR